MFVAKRLIDALVSKTQNDYLRENAQAIKYAALLHDLGHSPFSHITEEFFRRNPDYLPVAGENYDHETYTQLIIRHDEDIRNICSKEHADVRFVSKLAVGNSQTFLDCLLSGSVDIDKIDYIARDSYFCGLPYGRVDLSSLEQGIDISEDSYGDEIIAFDNKCRDVLEGLLISRFYLATSIHIDERNCAANQLLLRAIKEAYDQVIETVEEDELVDGIKMLILDCMHFRWVDHDLMTFLEEPVQKLRLAAMEADREGFSSLEDEVLEQIIQKTPAKSPRRNRAYLSHMLLNRVLQGRTPALRYTVPLVSLSTSARYSLHVLHALSPYTNYLNNFNKLIQSQKQCKGKRIYMDLIMPKSLELSTKIILEKDTLKNIFDMSSLMRSLVSDITNRLTLSIYSYKPFEKIPLTDLELLIGYFCSIARKRAVKKGKYLGTDMILMMYYFLYQERLFFEGDTRFQALFAVLFDDIVSKPQHPYKEISNLRRHFGNLNKEDNYEVFREKGYPNFFSVKFAQDLDVLTEMGMIYTRSEPVKIRGTSYFPKRYERRISHHGRRYVQNYLIKTYPFARILTEKMERLEKSRSCLIHLGT
jgi:HD superfamily phosphohydrolase